MVYRLGGGEPPGQKERNMAGRVDGAEGSEVKIRCGYTNKVYTAMEWEEVVAEAQAEWSEEEFQELVKSASTEVHTWKWHLIPGSEWRWCKTNLKIIEGKGAK